MDISIPYKAAARSRVSRQLPHRMVRGHRCALSSVVVNAVPASVRGHCLITQKRHPKPMTPYKSMSKGACDRIGPQQCPTYGHLTPFARRGLLWSRSPMCPFLSRSCFAGCPASGKAVIASSCVGWSSCKPFIQGGKPWKNSPAGPRPITVVAFSPPAEGELLECPSAGGMVGPGSPQHLAASPATASSISWAMAVTNRNGVPRIPWPKKVVKATIPAEPPSPVITGSAVLAFRKHRCENTP